jgi:hypothetical protein
MQHILNKKIINNKMGKIVLNETQYNRLKNILIENAIDRSLLNEEAYTLDTKKYTLKTNNFTNVKNREITIIGNATYTPTQKGNLMANGEIEYAKSKHRKPTKVYYMCNNEKFKIENNFYEILTNDPTYKGFKELCETLKKSKKDYYGIEKKGGSVKGYIQQSEYTLKSKDDKTITIPKNTGYTGKKDKKGNEGATFKLGPVSFGWFGCKSKNFIIDKVLYKDEKGVLANNISKAICGSVKPPEKEIIIPKDPAVYKGGGGRENYDTSEFDLYI